MLFKSSQHLVILQINVHGGVLSPKIKVKVQEAVQAQDMPQSISMPVTDWVGSLISLGSGTFGWLGFIYLTSKLLSRKQSALMLEF